MMRAKLFVLMMSCLFALPIYAGSSSDPTFTFEIDSGYQAGFTVENFERLQMTGGGRNSRFI